MSTVTTDDIDRHMSKWDCTGDAARGFVTFTWDMRLESLADLTDDYASLASDIAYSWEQAAIGRDRDDAICAAQDWIRESRDTLIAALRETLGSPPEDQ